MASTYTTNNGIEKPGTGEQSGTWGTTTNLNFDIIDQALCGVVSISLLGTTHTLSTTDGSLSDGMNRVLVLGGSPSGTNTVTISPNNQEKIYFVVNNSGQSAVFTQGSGANVTVLNGTQAIIYADGAGSGAVVAEIKPVASAGSIGTASIADDAITTAKIADNAVVTAAIADNAVIAEKIAATSIIAAKIADGNVTTVKLADDAVTSAKIADNAVGAAAINISGNGTAGQAVTSDGDGSFSYTTLTSAVPPTRQVFTSSGTWNRPSNCKTVKVTVVGGGGGSGAVLTDGVGGQSAGGAGGGAAIKYIDVTGTSSASVTVGVGGARGVTNLGAAGRGGGTGGTSSFGSFCSASGGVGGDGSTGGGNTPRVTREGGMGSNGDINIRGGMGNGFGASSIFAGCKGGVSEPNNGADGDVGGGGASPTGSNLSTSLQGGTGGAGLVLVEEYY